MEYIFTRYLFYVIDIDTLFFIKLVKLKKLTSTDSKNWSFQEQMEYITWSRNKSMHSSAISSKQNIQLQMMAL
jgi:hypothetical protein